MPRNSPNPYPKHGTITPHDSNDESYPLFSIYVGVAGDVVAVTEDGNDELYKNAQAGSYLVGRFKRVNNTNTTATNLLACW